MGTSNQDADFTTYSISNVAGILIEIRHALDRIATTQEGLLAIAAEARVERLDLANKMKQHLQAGFVGGKHAERQDQGQ